MSRPAILAVNAAHDGVSSIKEVTRSVVRPPSSWQPVYQRIARDIRAQIMSGEIEADQQITTEHELAARYGVARATVRQGLMLLVQEGLIVARRPLGYFAQRVDRLDWPVFNFEHEGAADAWVESVRAQGRTPRQDIRVEIVEPDDSIVEWARRNPAVIGFPYRQVRHCHTSCSVITPCQDSTTTRRPSTQVERCRLLCKQ